MPGTVGRYAWIGLHTTTPATSYACDLTCRRAKGWQWEDPATKYEDYSSWSGQEPDHPNEGCVIIMHQKANVWNAATCLATDGYYLCEKGNYGHL